MIFSFNNKKADALGSSVNEDDASLSSTLTVDRGAQQKLNAFDDDDDDLSIATTATSSTTSTTTTTTTIKSVRFNLEGSQQHANTVLCKEDCVDLWYTAAEYKHFKSMTIALAREVTKAEAKNRAIYSYERVLMRAYDVCKSTTTTASEQSYASPLSAEDRKHMRRWAEVAPSRLGLEKWAVKQMNRDRSLRRVELYDAVLDLQESLKDDDALEECLRRQSERISLPSRLFARCMADAQAESLRQDEFFGGFAC